MGLPQKYYIAQWMRPHGNRMEVERGMYEGDSKAEVVRGAKRIAKQNGWTLVGVVRAQSPFKPTPPPASEATKGEK